jgi:hypothetical protein
MTWPVTQATKVNLDGATDDPSQARAELVALIDSFNNLVSLLSKSGGNDKVLVSTSAGRLVLGGTDDGTNQLQVNGSGKFTAVESTNGTIRTVLSYSTLGVLGTLSNHGLQILINSIEAARFDASRNLLVPGIYSTTTTSAPNVFVDTDGTLKRSATKTIHGAFSANASTDPTIISGSGFTVSRQGQGQFLITFTSGFSGNYTFVTSGNGNPGVRPEGGYYSNTQATVKTYVVYPTAFVDSVGYVVYFIATGPS